MWKCWRLSPIICSLSHHLYPCSQFSSVAQSCLTLCEPMGCSMPGFPCSSSRYFSSLFGLVFCNRPHIQENNSFFLQLILPLPLYILFRKEASSTPNINSTPGKVVSHLQVCFTPRQKILNHDLPPSQLYWDMMTKLYICKVYNVMLLI